MEALRVVSGLGVPGKVSVAYPTGSPGSATIACVTQVLSSYLRSCTQA